MFPTFGKIGDAIERSGFAGWLLLMLGVGIIALTVLLPPWLENQRLLAQNAALRREADLLQLRHQNYVAFNRAVERSDPMLMQRLAMAQLHMKPVGTEPLDHRDVEKTSQVIDAWFAPQLPAVKVRRVGVPDTQLTRLIMGTTRPWVLAFGGWLMLLGIMIRPQILGFDEPEAPAEPATDQPAITTVSALALDRSETAPEPEQEAEPVPPPVVMEQREPTQTQAEPESAAPAVAVLEAEPPKNQPAEIHVPTITPPAPIETSKLTPVILSVCPPPLDHPPHAPVHSDAVFDHGALPQPLADVSHDLPHPPIAGPLLTPESSLFDPPASA